MLVVGTNNKSISKLFSVLSGISFNAGQKVVPV
jgi:hypothetical protein